jgi:hypothetical protein
MKTAKKTETDKFDFRTITSFEAACLRLKKRPKVPFYFFFLPKKYSRPIIAVYKLFIIFEAINNGWIADYGNASQKKWYVYYYVLSSGSGFVFSTSYYACDSRRSYVGSRLSTETMEQAQFIAETFPEEFKAFFLYSE